MTGITPQNISLFNQNLKEESVNEIIVFMLEHCDRPVLTTSFGGFSEVLIHAVLSIDNTIPVIWVDTGKNTSETYAHADYISHKYNANLDVFSPTFTNAFLDHKFGKPGLDNGNHEVLSDILKKEPLNRAFNKYNPDLWFTNLRKNQTAFRSSLDILSYSPNAMLKVSPFFHHSPQDLLAYVKANNLKTEFIYNDPIKAFPKRECGIHFIN